jgi:hypothetical protein
MATSVVDLWCQIVGISLITGVPDYFDGISRKVESILSLQYGNSMGGYIPILPISFGNLGNPRRYKDFTDD